MPCDGKLTRRLILAAALAITVVLNPVALRARRPCQRRRVLVRFDKPATWDARLCIFPRKSQEARVVRPARRDPPRVQRSFPLARRLEAVRRVLAHPDRRAHRVAVKLARIAARKATASEPRRFGVRDWDSSKARNRGEGFIRTGMDRVMPLIEDRLAAWSERCEPGWPPLRLAVDPTRSAPAGSRPRAGIFRQMRGEFRHFCGEKISKVNGAPPPSDRKVIKNRAKQR